MLINKQQVETFIPQKSPFVMVDLLLETNQSGSISQFEITIQNIFFKDGIFHEAGLIENIAQSAALAAGYEGREKNEAAEKGFIGAVKRLKIYKLPGLGDILTTTIHILNKVMNASIVKGEIMVNDELMAECELTIFTEEN